VRKEVATVEAERFTTFPGKCFRFTLAPNGRARHCVNRAVHTGQFTDAHGVVWTVDSCAEHAEDPRFQPAVVETKAHNYRVASGAHD
jgi:hypothetical protein